VLMYGAFFSCIKNKFCQKCVINIRACDSPCCQMYELGPQSVLEADVLMAELKAYLLCRLQSVD